MSPPTTLLLPLIQRTSSASEKIQGRRFRSPAVSDRIQPSSTSTNASQPSNMNNRTIRSTASRLPSKMLSTSSSSEAASQLGVNSPENGFNAQWWKLDEEGVSSSAAGGASASSWESSPKTDLIDFKALFRVKWPFNWHIVKRYSIHTVIGNLHLSVEFPVHRSNLWVMEMQSDRQIGRGFTALFNDSEGRPRLTG